MRPTLVDTSLYITALRTGNDAVLTVRRAAWDSPLWLSAAVLEELYAGAGIRERRVIDRLERDFDRVKRLLVPSLSDWTQTGRVLAQLASKHRYERVGLGRITNDALIAMSAARLGIRVLTANERDFRRLAELRPFQWELVKV